MIIISGALAFIQKRGGAYMQCSNITGYNRTMIIVLELNGNSGQ